MQNGVQHGKAAEAELPGVIRIITLELPTSANTTTLILSSHKEPTLSGPTAVPGILLDLVDTAVLRVVDEARRS